MLEIFCINANSFKLEKMKNNKINNDYIVKYNYSQLPILNHYQTDSRPNISLQGRDLRVAPNRVTLASNRTTFQDQFSENFGSDTTWAQL